MYLRWFLSRTIRQSVEMCKFVRRLLDSQKDILQPEAIKTVRTALDQARQQIRSGADAKAIQEEMNHLEKTANRHLKSYPHPAWRENVEVVLVALAVAMAIRTFILQPFKIPTGSMQPTLYGVTVHNLKHDPKGVIPGPLGRFYETWVKGRSYYHVVAKTDGKLVAYRPPQNFLFFFRKQSFEIGNTWYTVWFLPKTVPVVPMYPPQFQFLANAGVRWQHVYHRGEDIIKMSVHAGDHLFVDRMTYNFRHPKRGEIIVFATQGIEGLPQDQFFIKRLVGLGGETVQIGNDRHVRIDGRRLDAATPGFQSVYSFHGPPEENKYSGHVNGYVAREVGGPALAPLFPTAQAKYVVHPDHFLVLGDNTMDSLDSRTWGDLPRTNVIGRAFFVYWPVSPRFGPVYY